MITGKLEWNDFPTKAIEYEARSDVKSGVITVYEKINGQISKVRLNTQEKFIRDGLINLGWTPPPEKPEDEDYDFGDLPF